MLAIVKATAATCVEVPLSVTWLERNVSNLAFEQRFSDEPLAIVVGIEDAKDLDSWKQYFLNRCPRVVVDLNEGSVEEKINEAKQKLNEVFRTQS
jgi:hypothetical protein